MKIYRLSKRKHAKDLSGIGAKLAGGRWNEKGIPLVYTAQSRALCALEVAVHLPLSLIPKDYVMVTLYIPDNCYSELWKLPKNWNKFPYNKQTQKVTAQFVTDGKLALRVPSAVVQGELNVLINPNHKEISKVRILEIERFQFDARLFIRNN